MKYELLYKDKILLKPRYLVHQNLSFSITPIYCNKLQPWWMVGDKTARTNNINAGTIWTANKIQFHGAYGNK